MQQCPLLVLFVELTIMINPAIFRPMWILEIDSVYYITNVRKCQSVHFSRNLLPILVIKLLFQNVCCGLYIFPLIYQRTILVCIYREDCRLSTENIFVCTFVSVLMALKLDQLIWAATRGRHYNEMTRLWVSPHWHPQFPSVGCFTCLIIEHWVQCILWLYVTCNWQACWDFANEGHLKIVNPPIPNWDQTQYIQHSRFII